MFRFEKLNVWHRSVEFAGFIYDATEHFPAKEQFGLTSQLRRAAVSISANVAEGSSRVSNKDFSRFVEIAYGSLCETLSHLVIAKSRRLLTDEEYDSLYASAEELARMLSALRNSLGKWKPEIEGSEELSTLHPPLSTNTRG